MKYLQLSSVFSITLLLFLSSCETPEKVMKSSDTDYKYQKAVFWYNKKEYVKCIPIMEELIGLYKGTKNTENLYYMYCDANFKQGDYMISAYHFKNFYDIYPTAEKAEDCLFMAGRSYEKLSPKPDLDQTYTLKALDGYQFFLNIFPSSSRVNEANEAISRLRKRLEKKAMNNADLYYRTQNYRAAATSYDNLLRDYPDIDNTEKIGFMIVKSYYMFAQNSTTEKKRDRYRHTIDAFNQFKYKFPESKYMAEAQKYEHESHYYAAKAAFDWAQSGPLLEREKLFSTAFNEVKSQLPFITEEKRLEELNSYAEKGHFLIVKTYFQLSEEKKEKQKLSALEQTVKTYYTFVDKFPQSKFIKEAEKIFNITTEQIKKFKSNG
jgi:outer membrane protein assembly factor BamD